MGLFNAFLGLWLGMGVFFIPRLSKNFKIEWVACVFMALLGVSELITSISTLEALLWLLAFLIGTTGSVAWSATLTGFSNAVDEKSQGWALGITGSIVALSFIISGFSPNFIPFFGVMPLIGVGGILLLFASLIMVFYCRKCVE